MKFKKTKILLLTLITVVTYNSCTGFKAITQLAGTNSGTSSSTGTGSGGTSGTTIGLAASDAVPRLAGRKFVASKLRDIFAAMANTPVSNLIDGDAGNFGDPCDLYVRDFNGNQNYGDCRDLSNSQAPLVGPAAPSRQSLTMRACNVIIQNDMAVISAVTNAVGSDATSRAINDSDIQSLYEIFFSGRTVPSAVATSLKTIATTAAQKGDATIDQWRFVLLTLCTSPDWQIP